MHDALHRVRIKQATEEEEREWAWKEQCGRERQAPLMLALRVEVQSA